MLSRFGRVVSSMWERVYKVVEVLLNALLAWEVWDLLRGSDPIDPE